VFHDAQEFKRMSTDHGGFLVDVEPRSWNHVDRTILRIQIEVKSRDVVLPCRNMSFIYDLGNYHIL
jgi:hypothetical protein